MKRRRLTALLLIAATATSLVTGCGKGKDKSSEDGVKEFTAFFAVPNPEINDDNEIQQMIAEKTDRKSVV